MSTTSNRDPRHRSLRECENIIEQRIPMMLFVGQVVAEVRDGRLWRGTHRSFDEWANDRGGVDGLLLAEQIFRESLKSESRGAGSKGGAG